jgi:hypothetical protein
VSRPPNRMSPSIQVRFSSVEGHKCPEEAEGEKPPADGVEVGREPVDGFSRWVTRCAPSGRVLSRVSTGRFLNLRAAQFAEAGVSGFGNQRRRSRLLEKSWRRYRDRTTWLGM